jgi:subtilisin-like proprotein convertase family protein
MGGILDMTSSKAVARIASLAVAVAAVTVAGAASGPGAGAAATTYSSTAPVALNESVISTSTPGAITITDNTTATPYPSNLTVSGANGVITNLGLDLTSFSHGFPDDVDIMLVGPHGQRAVVMSDVGGSTTATNVDLDLNDLNTDPLPDNTALSTGSYQPANYEAVDSFPSSPGSVGAGSALSAFDGTDPNGVWQLYVVDDDFAVAGSLGGWSLNITIANSANPYPSVINVASPTNGITDVNVSLTGLSHTYPSDIDLLLVGPTGLSTVLVSDAGGSTDISGVNLTLDDEATASLPDSGGLASGTFKPTNINDPFDYPDEVAAPAPGPASWSGSLSVFDGTNPNGQWRLFAVDDVGTDTGTIAGGWSLQISAVDRPVAPVITAPPTNTRDRDGAFTMTGTAPASTSVKVYDGATLKTTVAATAAGQWTAAISGVPNGSHTFTATATDGFGNVSAASAAVVVIVDSVKPQISSTVPAKGAKHASVRKNIKARASEALRARTVTKANAFIVVAGTTTHLQARVTYRPLTHTIVINPKAHLAHGTKYKVTITTRVLDLAGNPLDQNRTRSGLQKKTWKFTTR